MRAFAVDPTVPITVAPRAACPLRQDHADAAGRRMDEHPIARPGAPDAVDDERRGEALHHHGRGLGVGDALRQGHEARRRHVARLFLA